MSTSKQNLSQDEWSVVMEFVNFHDCSNNLSLSMINKSWYAKSCSDEFWKFKYLNRDDEDRVPINDNRDDFNAHKHLGQEVFKRKLIRERRNIFFYLSDQQFEIVSILIQVGTVMAVLTCSLLAFIFVLNNVGELLKNTSLRRSGFEEIGYRNRFYVENSLDSCLIRNIEPFSNKCEVSARFIEIFGSKAWANVYLCASISIILSLLSFFLAIIISYLRKFIDMDYLIEGGKITERSAGEIIEYRSTDIRIMLALFIMCRLNLDRKHMLW